MYYSLLCGNALKKSIILVAFLVFGLMGCRQNSAPETPSPTLVGEVTPYLTATPSPTPDRDTLVTPVAPTQIPTPSPTPFIYAVVADDTLTGIAFRHSVSLEDLLAANPGIDPNFLTIGLTLTIPIEGVIVSALLTPTPIPLRVDPPVCYPAADGQLQCLAIVHNEQLFAVENVIAQITLPSIAEDEPHTQTAISPLNLLPAGQKAAVSARFAPPIPANFVPEVSLLTVIPISDEAQRYLNTESQINPIEVSSDGTQARVTGSVELLPDQVDASVVWVAAFAYDAQNQIIGLRKWTAEQSLLSGGQIEFELLVYSLGPPITSVEILTEARP